MNNIIKAEEGKVFRRIADGHIYGKEISLGYSYYINGIKLDKPHLDTPEDFEQIDEPIKEDPNQRAIKEDTEVIGGGDN
jgi:hypothetical protein